MAKQDQSQTVESLDSETRAALQEGLRLADQNVRRWTPEQVTEDAKKMAKEWQERVSLPASA